ncbi:hypothetical protein V5799_029824 [Amblyomma americanum]|uniref:E3 ubiquitin-protein ligase APD1-4 middle domain-containing protein n=1 Tax=Amblyomma americanum TaxID=6943 RepID=A0AAQ4EQ17_AMBAM
MAFSLKKLLLVWMLLASGVLMLSTPLVLRFSVYSERTLAMGYQDVIPLREHVSTFWCENLTTTSTHTFNAYLYDGAEPNVTEHATQAQSDGYHYLLFLNDPATEAYNDVQLSVHAWRRVFDRNQSVDACHEALNCSLPLAFRSAHFVVAERSRSMPPRVEPVFLRALCEPRRKVYFFFYLAFAVLFVIVAFQ